MHTLRFAHRFFHFSATAWERLTEREPGGEKLLRRLFREPLLPRRELEEGSPQCFEAARELHARRLEQEESFGIRALPASEAPPGLINHLRPSARPALLYLRGAPPPEESQCVAIVGTRRPSGFGRRAADCFASYFAALGFRVVSGLARGIDTIAHERSLSSGTVAVLGAGLGEVYPPENQVLAERILAEGGTLLSPYPLGQVPLPQNFPARNDWIAALAAGTVVIEGCERSGAGITGRRALAMGKAVVALTQDFRSAYGRGAIRLQQDGATLVASEEEAAEAIFSRLGGYSPLAAPLPAGRDFSLADFQRATKLGTGEALALLEEGILLGKLERVGARFRRRAAGSRS